MRKVQVVSENVHLYEIDPRRLTTDCMVVIRMDGIVDVVKSKSMVDVFDFYHDLGIRLKKIKNHCGTRNPKFHDPEPIG